MCGILMSQLILSFFKFLNHKNSRRCDFNDRVDMKIAMSHGEMRRKHRLDQKG
jgi:hypothetical protein